MVPTPKRECGSRVLQVSQPTIAGLCSPSTAYVSLAPSAGASVDHVAEMIGGNRGQGPSYADLAAGGGN